MSGRHSKEGCDAASPTRRNAVVWRTLPLLAVAIGALVRGGHRRLAPRLPARPDRDAPRRAEVTASPGGATGGRRRLRDEAAETRAARRDRKRPRGADLAAFADPRTVVPKGQGDGPSAAAAVVTVYVPRQNARLNHASSFFVSGDVARYGTGRVRYDVVEDAPSKCLALRKLPGKAPCLVAAPANLYPPSRRECLYSRCRVMATNDERCEVAADAHGVRQYFSATHPQQVYLPLGVRIDAWRSFQKHREAAKAPAAVPPASRRRYAFNAIFTQNTNYQRVKLAELLRGHEGRSPPFYASIAQQWHRVANDPTNDLVHTDNYTATLLDSVFTLAPAGKNPESYRLFEAAEAGSIPVMVRDEMLNRAPQLNVRGRPIKQTMFVHCEGSLRHWLQAPIVILESWDELFPTIERLIQDMAALDEMQARLSQWYTEYMRGVVRVFEDYMLGTTKQR